MTLADLISEVRTTLSQEEELERQPKVNFYEQQREVLLQELTGLFNSEEVRNLLKKRKREIQVYVRFGSPPFYSSGYGSGSVSHELEVAVTDKEIIVRSNGFLKQKCALPADLDAWRKVMPEYHLLYDRFCRTDVEHWEIDPCYKNVPYLKIIEGQIRWLLK
ncbi:MAG: hypothetical protein WCV90_03390 [Candidatus Woesearchaeota archaeon]|jgi:hypothetical protein